VGVLHSLIDAIASTGVTVIKFQMHVADAESCAQDEFRIPFSRVDATRMDYWRRMELSQAQWSEVKSHCEELGCEFLCTPFSIAAVVQLETMGVARYKVGSGDTSNALLLDALGATGKPVILSSGMSSYDELDDAVERLVRRGSPVSVMQCTSEYPVSPERWGLNVLFEIRDRYGVPYGLSDHSGSIVPGLAAAALGATLIEVHATFDRRMFGPDATSSLTIDELAELVRGVGSIRTALDHPVDKGDADDMARMRRLFGRSLTVRRDMAAGEVLSFDDLECTKPAGLGVPPQAYEQLIGRRLKRALPLRSFIMEEDIE
jgi:N-acetylneuraminate synthase